MPKNQPLRIVDSRTAGGRSGSGGLATTTHTHDSRYYLRETVDTLLAGKSDIDHDHDDLVWWRVSASSARLWGGGIFDNGDGTVTVAAGAGLVLADEAGPEDGPDALDDGQASAPSLVEWDEDAAVSLTDNAYNYIYITSAGAVAATTDFYSISFTQEFTVGRVYRSGTAVTIRLCGTNAWNFNRRVQLFGEEVFPVVRARGLVLGSTGTRNLTITKGVLWAELVNRFSVGWGVGMASDFDSSGTDTWTYWYRNGSGGWTAATGATQINNTQYDDGDGTLGTLTANRYGVHWVYVVHDASVHVIFGQGDYTLAQAEISTPPAALPGVIGAYATLIGRVIVQKSSNTLAIESAFETTFVSSGVTSHNDLADLTTGDPHTQYPLSAGRSGGQTIVGGTASGDDLTLTSTSNATKGDIIVTDRMLAAADILADGSTAAAEGLNARLEAISGDKATAAVGYSPIQRIVPASWALGSSDGSGLDDFFRLNDGTGGSLSQWAAVSGCTPYAWNVSTLLSHVTLQAGHASDAVGVRNHAIIQETISGHTSGDTYSARMYISNMVQDQRVGMVMMDADALKGAAGWLIYTHSTKTVRVDFATYASANAWLSQANAKTSSVAWTTDWTTRFTGTEQAADPYIMAADPGLRLRVFSDRLITSIVGASAATFGTYDSLTGSALGFTPATLSLFVSGNVPSTSFRPTMRCDLVGRIATI